METESKVMNPWWFSLSLTVIGGILLIIASYIGG